MYRSWQQKDCMCIVSYRRFFSREKKKTREQAWPEFDDDTLVGRVGNSVLCALHSFAIGAHLPILS
jgi:hypothetical protein